MRCVAYFSRHLLHLHVTLTVSAWCRKRSRQPGQQPRSSQPNWELTSMSCRLSWQLPYSCELSKHRLACSTAMRVDCSADSSVRGWHGVCQPVSAWYAGCSNMMGQPG